MKLEVGNTFCASNRYSNSAVNNSYDIISSFQKEKRKNNDIGLH